MVGAYQPENGHNAGPILTVKWKILARNRETLTFSIRMIFAWCVKNTGVRTGTGKYDTNDDIYTMYIGHIFTQRNNSLNGALVVLTGNHYSHKHRSDATAVITMDWVSRWQIEIHTLEWQFARWNIDSYKGITIRVIDQTVHIMEYRIMLRKRFTQCNGGARHGVVAHRIIE